MTGSYIKLLGLATNGLKWLKMSRNVWEYHEIAENGCKQLEMAVNCQEWPEMEEN